MTEGTPIVCSLGASDLRQRLDEIAEVGAESLIERSTDGERHLLRFRSDPETRRGLEAIVAAEAKCCSFLDLSLEEQGGELVLTVSAPQDGQPVAEELAAAFAGNRRISRHIDFRHRFGLDSHACAGASFNSSARRGGSL
jgi:ribosomal protein S15P/S13E